MMWNNLLDNAKKVAEQAKAAAESLEDQLNESVGVTPEMLASNNSFDKQKGSAGVNSGNGNGSLLNSLGRSLLNAVNESFEKEEVDDNTDDDDDAFFNDDPFYDDDVDVNMHDKENKQSDNHEGMQQQKYNTVDNGVDIMEEEQEQVEEEVMKIHDIASESTDPITPTSNQEEEVVEFQEQIYNKEDQADECHEDDINKIQENNIYEGYNQEKSASFSDQEITSLEQNGYEENTQDMSYDQVECYPRDNEIENEVEQVEENTREIDNKMSSQNIPDSIPIAQSPIANGGYTNDIVNSVKDDDMNVKDNHCDNMDDIKNYEVENDYERKNEEPSNADETALESSPSRIQVDNNMVDSSSALEEDDELSVFVSKEEIESPKEKDSKVIEMLKKTILDLQNSLAQRENQLATKSEQMFTMAETHEKEKSFLESKVRETKEEAKKRIGKAKEKVDLLQSKLTDAVARADSVGSSSTEQEEIIKALRKEGETLALKQSKMEELVREARSELRDVKEELEGEMEEKEKALQKVNELNQLLLSSKTELSAAREGQGRAEKLDSDLLVEREEREKNASKVLNLEATIKTMKSEHAETIKEIQKKLDEQISKVEAEKLNIGKEKDNLIKDLELKLRTSERESNLREDSLRHEVSELRKRWQESVRRSDALSMDLQQSSAPLMRQLESAERQNRARASAWAELESKLRVDLEETLVKNETLNKERYDIDAELKRLNKRLKDKEDELSSAQAKILELKEDFHRTSTEYNTLVAELEKTVNDFDVFREQTKENESKLRSEMIMSFRENEERYNDSLESLEVDLRQEKEKRLLLEEKIKEINTSTLASSEMSSVSHIKSKKRSLSGKDKQADILQSTLFGINGVEDESDNEDNDNDPSSNEGVQESFAFIEQLSQALKAAKSDKESLRKQLLESEEKRTILENECAMSRDAIQRLPSLEARVSELMQSNEEKDMEIGGLTQDIFEVRKMYRSQLDVLLEEKASGKTSNAIQTATTELKPSISNVVPKYGMMPSF